MGEAKGGRDKRVVRLAVGFACLQGYLLSVFYDGIHPAVLLGSFSFARPQVLLILAWTVLAFVLLRVFSAKARDAALSRTLLWCYVALLAVGAALAAVPGENGAPVAFEGLVIGIPSALLMAAWGRAFALGGETGAVAVLASAGLAGILALPFCLLPPAANVALGILPVASCAALCSLEPYARAAQAVDGSDRAEPAAAPGHLHPDASSAPVRQVRFSDVVASKDQRDETMRLSTKMLSGTFVFGAASGFMQVFRTDAVHEGSAAVSMLLLVFFSLAALQLLGAGRTDESRSGAAQGQNPLAEVYRLALLLMMAGFLFVPVLGSFGVPGEAIVLAGYLGLSFVLVALFLRLSKARGLDPALAFASGFSSLYLGVMDGIVLGNGMVAVQPPGQIPFVVAAVAGLAALFAYLFLFTERDFEALSSLARTVDVFSEVCDGIASTYKLSKRESEILPLALRGRTGERIASELFISKSTAETHLRRIYAKTGTHGRQELIDLSETMRQSIQQSLASESR
ncbi:helix-turn-helix transcriptional regulator [Xiamenia xianingshaonis]|uniref:Helix-turn-helix transcriptional regulator n=1 Tax=Xiamenia xianingshaonis TaxID=2682776 RepID=A0A9E6MP70_9ACTN|nr:helix-turn-helix transcriptional regulator [Xiamenia xianingshaonis]NHM13837.1 LuxR family transcriptional regulator [Xiamenia xianingshaonis]QTU83696.1 helix-turn-helix transcriptional regulator [Xiamenia xianingshaonis]